MTQPQPAYVRLLTHRHQSLISLPLITHVSGQGNYCTVHIQGKRTLLYSITVGNMHKRLGRGFIRIHKSHLVNLSAITGMRRGNDGRWQVRVGPAGGLWVSASRRGWPRVKDAVLARLAEGEGG